MLLVKNLFKPTPLCTLIGLASVLGATAEPHSRYGADRDLGHEVISIKRELDATTGRVSKLEGDVRSIRNDSTGADPISYSRNTPAPISKHSGSGQRHRVQPGETLSSIARTYQIGVDRLVAENHITNPNALKVGQEIYIPGRKGSTASTPPKHSDPKQSAPSGKASSYSIRSGDTLSSIARRYGITATAITRANGISDPNSLTVGQKINIPDGSGSTYAQGRAKESTPPTPASKPKPNREDELIAPEGHGFYQVEKGDTLHSIAISFGTNTNELRRLNDNVQGNSLHIGTFLLVPVPDESLYES